VIRLRLRSPDGQPAPVRPNDVIELPAETSGKHQIIGRFSHLAEAGV
jgi:hypothetical protein